MLMVIRMLHPLRMQRDLKNPSACISSEMWQENKALAFFVCFFLRQKKSCPGSSGNLTDVNKARR
jgi:hypothetical protein